MMILKFWYLKKNKRCIDVLNIHPYFKLKRLYLHVTKLFENKKENQNAHNEFCNSKINYFLYKISYI